LKLLGRDNLDEELRSTFVKYGPIEWISLEPKVRKKGKKEKKPNSQWMKQRVDYALICMIYEEDAKKAMEAINANYDSEIWCTPSPVVLINNYFL
jgi:hypothetical protein